MEDADSKTNLRFSLSRLMMESPHAELLLHSVI